MTTYTAGPWLFDPDTDKISTEDRKKRFFTYIANVPTGFSEPFESEQQANARLIAAAPDLLEALQSISDCCDEDHCARDYASRQIEIRGIARAAITKATGERK